MGNLAVAGIDGEDLGCAVLEHAIGESARGGSDVEAEAVEKVDVPVGEGSFEFESASANVTEVGAKEADGGIGRDGGAGLVLLLLVDEDAASEDDGLSAFAGGSQTAVNPSSARRCFRP